MAQLVASGDTDQSVYSQHTHTTNKKKHVSKKFNKRKSSTSRVNKDVSFSFFLFFVCVILDISAPRCFPRYFTVCVFLCVCVRACVRLWREGGARRRTFSMFVCQFVYLCVDFV